MKKLAILVILLAAAGGGYYYYSQYGKTEAKPQVVQAAIAQGDIVEQVQATGALESLRTVVVGPQVSGTILSLENVDFNSIVKAGQVVAKLDPSLLQVQVDIQQANVERQQTDIESQKVQLLDAQRNLARTKELSAKGLTTESQLETADLNVKTRLAQIASAEKQLVQARANLSQAQLNVSYTLVKSPIDGVVVNRRVDVGQSVQSSMNITPFFDIATDLRQLKLNAGVDEADIGKIQRGMNVVFTVDSYLPQQFHGTVNAVRLNAQSQNNVVTYPVWIDVPNPDLKLRPSMTATVRIITNSVPNAIRIPNTALRFRPTTEIYTALGLTPPPAPVRGGGEGRRGAGADAGAAVVGQTAAAGAGRSGAVQSAPRGTQAAGAGRQPATGQNAGRQTAGGQNAPGGRGGQGFGRNSNLSPEERQRMREQFQAGGGRGGRGGRGGDAGGARMPGGRGGAPVAANTNVEATPLNSGKIDDLFQTTPVRQQNGTVWTWDEKNKKLTDHRVTYGLTDGVASQMISGDLKVGDQVVTSIIVPQTTAQRQNNLFGGQQQFRGGGGLQPGGVGGPGGPGGGFGGGGGQQGGGRGGGGAGGGGNR